jgi:RNA polymerase-binding transcription factor DksA
MNNDLDDFRHRLMNLAELHKGGPLSAALTSALQKLDSGHFGLCESCGASLPERVLHDRPWARMCQKCQNFVDTQEMPDSRSLPLRSH